MNWLKEDEYEKEIIIIMHRVAIIVYKIKI